MPTKLLLRHELGVGVLGELTNPAFMTIELIGDGRAFLVVGFEAFGEAVHGRTELTYVRT